MRSEGGRKLRVRIHEEGKFFTPSISNDSEMNEHVLKQTKASVLELTKFTQDDRSLQVVIGKPTAFETLHFVD